MNCSNTEKLLPLYARVDLDRSSQSAVAAHLESCAHCRQLADEYKNIQGWIRLHEPPEFDDEFFAGIRQNVLREISRRPAHSSTLSTWLRKLVAPTLPARTFAAAATALLIISFALGLVVFREYRSRPEFYAQNETPRSEPQKGTAVNANSGTLPTEDKSQTQQEVKNGSGPGVALNVNRVRHRITRTTPRAITLPTKDTLASVTEFTSTDSSSAPSVESGLSEGQVPLRVEMQTQNPNIRIIWFAPNTKKSSVTN
jgi:anti-sigma factor RsiW